MAAKEMAQPMMQSRAAGGASASTLCYSGFGSNVNELTAQTADASSRCNSLLSDATTQANANLEVDRENLNKNSNVIQSDLQSCQGNIPTNEAIDCYMQQGQGNINPVSSLSSGARTAQRNFENTINTAKVQSEQCDFEVSQNSETTSAKMFANLNSCLAGNEWVDVPIPEMGPPSQTPAPTEVSTETTEEPVTVESTPDPTPTVEPETEN
ncbi:hypothetical protein ACFFRR_007518 [Megaselia abdita]